jgi:hypothetical protein
MQIRTSNWVWGRPHAAYTERRDGMTRAKVYKIHFMFGINWMWRLMHFRKSSESILSLWEGTTKGAADRAAWNLMWTTSWREEADIVMTGAEYDFRVELCFTGLKLWKLVASACPVFYAVPKKWRDTSVWYVYQRILLNVARNLALWAHNPILEGSKTSFCPGKGSGSEYKIVMRTKQATRRWAIRSQ